MRIAVDVGRTFTDVVVLDEAATTLRVEKVETTPHDPYECPSFGARHNLSKL